MTAHTGFSTNAVVSYHVLHARGSLNMVSANSVVRVNNTRYSLPRRHIYGASVTNWSTIRKHTHSTRSSSPVLCLVLKIFDTDELHRLVNL